jgi:hypothetical protein
MIFVWPVIGEEENLIKNIWTNFKCKTSICNEIDFNVIFLVVPLQWTIVNIDGMFIVVTLLLCY